MNRRQIVVATGTLALVRPVAAAEPRRTKPQPDDVLVHAFGDRAGVEIAPADVGAEPVSAFPKDPLSGVVRGGSLHNQLAVIRLDRDRLSAKAQRYAVDAPPGVILVFSAACTHTGCEVNGWHAESRHLVCPCHGSEFDVADAARVVNGPAPKPLAMLRVALTDGVVEVVGGFSRRVGPEPP